MSDLYPKSCPSVTSIQSLLSTTNTFDQVMLKNFITPVDITAKTTTTSINELIFNKSDFQLPVRRAEPAPANDFLFGIPKIYSQEQKTIVLIDYNEQKLRYTEAQFTLLEDFYENLLGQLSSSVYTKDENSVAQFLSTIKVSSQYKPFRDDREIAKKKYKENIAEIIAKGIFSKKVLEGSPDV
jgi:hypothetical protein